MFGWKRRRARKAAQKAHGGAHLKDVPPEDAAAPSDEPRINEARTDEARTDDTRVDVVEWPAEDEPAGNEDGPGPEEEPESEPDAVRTERPMVDLLTEGERLGFDPELHIPEG